MSSNGKVCTLECQLALDFRMFWLSLFIFLNVYSFNLNSKLHTEFLTREHWCKGAGFMLLFPQSCRNFVFVLNYFQSEIC